MAVDRALLETRSVNDLPPKPGDPKVNHGASNLTLNDHLIDEISASISASRGRELEEDSRSELDSHANMCVVGSHAQVLS